MIGRVLFCLIVSMTSVVSVRASALENYSCEYSEDLTVCLDRLVTYLRELQNISAQTAADLQKTRGELAETRKELAEARGAVARAQQTADQGNATANGARDAVSAIRNGREAVPKAHFAERSLMLRERDDSHWLRVQTVDGDNRGRLMMWRVDGVWFDNVRVDACGRSDWAGKALMVRERDDNHYGRFNGWNWQLWRENDNQWFGLGSH